MTNRIFAKALENWPNFICIGKENSFQKEKVNFYNSLGQLVKTTTANVVSTIELAKGSYFVEVVTNEGKATKQLLVQ